MPTRLSTIDLGDREAVYYCLRCGATYRRTIPRCVGCDAKYLERRSGLIDRLHRSAPHEEISELDTIVLVPLSQELADDSLPVIAAGLREEGYVHLFVDGEGRPVEDLEGNPGLTLCVPDDERKIIEERISDWLALSEGQGQPSAEEDELVLLAISSDPIETAAIGNELDAADIPYTTNPDARRLSAMLTGHATPAIRFFVSPDDWERADALLDQLENGWEGELPPMEESSPAGEEASATEEAVVEAGSSAQPVYQSSRVIRVARWALVLEGIVVVLAGSALFATGVPELKLAPLLGLALIGAAIYAGSQPQNAFGIGLLLQSPIIATGFLVAQLTGTLITPSILFIILLIAAYRAARSARGETGSS